MKHTTVLNTMFAGLVFLSACSQNGVAPEHQNILAREFDANSVQSMRLSRLSEPMVWGGPYFDENSVYIIPGGSTWDTAGSSENVQCLKEENWSIYIKYVPQYQDADVFLARIKSVAEDVELLNPGKLMVFKNWKFVTDVNRGVHIYDDSDPKNPKKVAFLYVPGVLDIALKNNMLYANAYSALVTIDITEPNKAKAIHMLPDAFPAVYWVAPIMDTAGNVAVAWRADTVHVCYAEENTGLTWDKGQMVDSPASVGHSNEENGNSNAQLGQNASMSRFAISPDWLYTVDQSALRLFDIRQERTPKKGDVVQTEAWDLETIFRYEDALFLGSMTGMHIYDNSSGTPVKASTYSHVTSCDPVVVQDDIAYVTLRAGMRCARGNNELNVIDVSDIYNPKELAVYPMQNPAGLAIEDNTLFICEGDHGLAVLDVENPAAPKEIARVLSVQPEDVIASEGILTLIGPSGIWRMDYSDPSHLKELSFTESLQPEMTEDEEIITPDF